MIYTDDDVKLLAKCGYLEARGEPPMGLIAVMHCVYNRVGAPGFPKTIYDVIYEPNAFSWTRADNPEFGMEPPSQDPIYQTCLADAECVLKGESDCTRGSLYYANESQTGEGWYRTHIIENPEHPVMLAVGKHTFRR